MKRKQILAGVVFFSVLTAIAYGIGIHRIPQDSIRFGAGGDTDNKVIEFDRAGAADPALQFNVSTGAFQFSNDGTNFQDFGTGSGGVVNVLDNPGCEAEDTGPTDPANWTESAGTLTRSTTASEVAEGNASCKWDADAASDTLKSDAVTVANILKGNNCLARLHYRYATGSIGDLRYRIEDAANQPLTEYVDLGVTGSDEFRIADLAFICPVSGSFKVAIESTVDAGELIIDANHLGEDFRIGSLGPEIEGWSAFTPSFNNDTALAFTVNQARKRRVGDSLEISLNVTPTGDGTDAGDLQLVLPDSLTLENTGDEELGHLSLIREAGATDLALGGRVIATSSPDNVIRFQSEDPAPGSFTTLNGNHFGTSSGRYRSLGISVIVPIAEWLGTGITKTITIETQDFTVSGRFDAGAPLLAVADDAGTYNEITDSALNLATNAGSSDVQIACVAPNPPVGTDCGGNTESFGINFTAPNAGFYKVSFQFTHNVQGDAGEDLLQYFKIAETSETSAAILQEPAQGQLRRFEFAAASQSNELIMHISAIFNFSGPGSKTIRLFESTGGTANANANSIRCDGTADRECYFEVIALSQRIPQTVAIAGINPTASTSTGNTQQAERGWKNYAPTVLGANANCAPGNTVAEVCCADAVFTSQSGARLVPYQLDDGSWHLRFNFACGDLGAGATASQTFEISGVDFDGYHAVSCMASDQPDMAVGSTQASGNVDDTSNTVTCYATATSDSWAISGDIPLTAKPLWAD